MSLDELAQAAAAQEGPQTPPRKKSLDARAKPIEDMSVDEMMEAAALEPPQPPAADAASDTGSWDDEKVCGTDELKLTLKAGSHVIAVIVSIAGEMRPATVTITSILISQLRSLTTCKL